MNKLENLLNQIQKDSDYFPLLKIILNKLKSLSKKEISKEIEIFLEILKGENLKIESKENKLFLDRLVSIPYPCAYGYYPLKISADGDPLDCFLLFSDFIGTKYLRNLPLKVIPFLKIKMNDSGEEDDKILVLPSNMLNDLNKRSNFENILENHLALIVYEISSILNFLKLYKSDKKLISEIELVELYPDEF